MSVVQEGSAKRLRSTHTSFKRLATGSHVFLSILSGNTQYTCTPLPELMQMGCGKSRSVQNCPSAAIARSREG